MTRPVRQVIAFGALAGALAVLALPSVATAKGDLEVMVCGASECMRTGDPGTVGPLHSTFAPAPAPVAAPFYVVSFHDGPRQTWSYVYVPSARAMLADSFGRGSARWREASLIRPNLPDLTRLEPHPAAKTWRLSDRRRSEVAWASFQAAAAEAEVARVCGASACVETDVARRVLPLTSNIGAPASEPPPAPFYVVSFQDPRGEAWSYLYVPSAGAMRADEFGHGPARWRDAPPEVVSALPDLTGLEPHAASDGWVVASGGPDAPRWLLPAALAALLLALAVALVRRPRRPAYARGLTTRVTKLS